MLARFASDSSVAATAHAAGEGRAVLVAFLPALSWFKPALPSRPIDICARDDAARLVLCASTLAISIQTLEDSNQNSTLSAYDVIRRIRTAVRATAAASPNFCRRNSTRRRL